MALPTIGDFMTAQQSVNPFAAQALQQATAGSGRMAEAQQQAALAQLAMNPNVAQTVSRPEEATTAASQPTRNVANVRQPQFRNLGFSQLNALASQTPQSSFTPQSTIGGNLAAGITSGFNVRQQRQAQQNIMGLMQQQQAAAQQAIQQQQAAAQQKAALEAQQAQQQVAALEQSGLSPEQALGLVASGQGGTALAKLGELVGGGVNRTIAQQDAARALEIAPNLSQRVMEVPLTAAQQLELDALTGGEFNPYQPVIDLKEGKEALAGAASAAQREQLELEADKADVEAKQLSNQFAPFEESRKRQSSEIEKLEAEGKLQEAQDKRDQLAQQERMIQGVLPYIDQLTPAERQQYKLLGQMIGLDPKVFDAPEGGTSKVVKVGKNKYAQQAPSGELQLIDPNKLPKQGEAQGGTIDVFAGPQDNLQAPVLPQDTGLAPINLPAATNIGVGKGLQGGFQGSLQGSLRPIELGG